MGIRGRTILATALLLGGCIPPTARVPVASIPPAAEPQRAAPAFDAVTTERPAWEIRPVVPNAIVVDGKRFHKVAVGETGIAIARAYGVPWSRLVEANALTEPFVIKVGQRLLLPDTNAPSIEARARAFRLNIDDILTGGEPALPRRATAIALAVEPSRPVGRFDWPVPGRIVSRFGPAGAGRFNQGIDIAAPSGGAIRAAADGVVAFVGDGIPGYGGLILVRHGGGWISAYGYAARADVKRGDSVKRGAAIGMVSSEFGPALHFELRKDRKPVDPVLWLPRR